MERTRLKLNISIWSKSSYIIFEWSLNSISVKYGFWGNFWSTKDNKYTKYYYLHLRYVQYFDKLRWLWMQFVLTSKLLLVQDFEPSLKITSIKTLLHLVFELLRFLYHYKAVHRFLLIVQNYEQTGNDDFQMEKTQSKRRHEQTKTSKSSPYLTKNCKSLGLKPLDWIFSWFKKKIQHEFISP